MPDASDVGSIALIFRPVDRFVFGFESAETGRGEDHGERLRGTAPNAALMAAQSRTMSSRTMHTMFSTVDG